MTNHPTKLYLAYGSNMNKAQMRQRCPKAKPLRAIVIDDARLVFRGVADIEFCRGASVPVVLWEITADCERALDRFEGVAQGVYEKKMIPLDNDEHALTYVMCSNGVAPPTRDYYERIKQGYADFGIDPEPLDVALKHSHVKQAHSPETRRRLARNIASGNTVIARRPMHIALDKVSGSAPECGVHDEQCQHGNDPVTCRLCEARARDQGELPLRKPVARPLEGYNYSQRARDNSAKRCGPHCQCEVCEANKRAARRAASGHKDGKPTGRKVHSTGRSVEETEATRTGVVRYNNGKRSNTRTTVTKRKNLSDWLKDKGYSGDKY